MRGSLLLTVCVALAVVLLLAYRHTSPEPFATVTNLGLYKAIESPNITAAKKFIKSFILNQIGFQWLWPVFYETHPNIPKCFANQPYPHQPFVRTWIQIFSKREWHVLSPSTPQKIVDDKFIAITDHILYNKQDMNVWIRFGFVQRVANASSPQAVMRQEGYAEPKFLGRFVMPLYSTENRIVRSPPWPTLTQAMILELWSRKCFDHANLKFALGFRNLPPGHLVR